MLWRNHFDVRRTWQACLKIKALENSITEEAVDLMRQAYALLPRVKITDLLIEVDSWANNLAASVGTVVIGALVVGVLSTGS